MSAKKTIVIGRHFHLYLMTKAEQEDTNAQAAPMSWGSKMVQKEKKESILILTPCPTARQAL